MKRLIATATLLLAGATVLAAPPAPPTARIAAQLGLDSYQTTEVERIMKEARARIDAAAKDSMAQADAELATVLTVEQLSEFKKLMQAARANGRPPGSPPPPTDQ